MGQFQEPWKCQSEEEAGHPRNLWKKFKIDAIYLKDCDCKSKGKKEKVDFKIFSPLTSDAFLLSGKLL